jgi:hypothetical protein
MTAVPAKSGYRKEEAENRFGKAAVSENAVLRDPESSMASGFLWSDESVAQVHRSRVGNEKQRRSSQRKAVEYPSVRFSDRQCRQGAKKVFVAIAVRGSR